MEFSLVYVYFCMLCLIVMSLSPGKYQFAVKLNNSNNKLRGLSPRADFTNRATEVSANFCA
jgi:hypothetical protein